MKRELKDFDNVIRDTGTQYGGSCKKQAIIFDEKRYMIKYPKTKDKTTDLNAREYNNVISEYVSSHIIEAIGLPVHHTELGYRDGQIVVGCENFLKPNENLYEYGWFLMNHYNFDNISKIIDYRQFYEMIDLDELLFAIEKEIIEGFWDMFVVDALIGNGERYKDNIGYIYNKDLKSITKCSPIYDCGCSLYPALSEREMIDVLKDEAEILKRVYLYPTASLTVDGKTKVSYYDMLSSRFDKNCAKSLLKIAPKIDLEKINRVIEETPAISHTRKLFYKTMVRVRKELIIDKAYEMIKNEKNDIEAYNRIVNGVAVAETDMLNIIEKVKKDGWEYSKLFDNVNKEERKILEDNHIIYNNHSEKAIESNDEYER